PKVHLGDTATIQIDAYNDRIFRGIVTQIASSNNGASTQTDLTNTSTDVTNYKVYIRLDPDSYKDLIGAKKRFPFRPGMSASADIQTRTHTNVLSIPINAVTTREKSDSTTNNNMNNSNANNSSGDDNSMSGDNDLDVVVFVLQKADTVKKQNVKSGIQDINYIEITDGLKEGDDVITGPYDVVSKTLKSGDKVKVVSKSQLFSDQKK
ncbi:MAG TPA: efflux transporter periplasmic adaptor subunit, partial [Hanamia sp.]